MRPTDGPANAPVEELLRVDRLTILVDGPGGPAPAVEEVSFAIRRGETLGLVGESGSGKTLTALAILRLLPPATRIAGGRVLFQGRDLVALDERDLRAVRGAGIGIVFQEPAAALSPVFTIGDQIAETLRAHGRARSWREAIETIAPSAASAAATA